MFQVLKFACLIKHQLRFLLAKQWSDKSSEEWKTFTRGRMPYRHDLLAELAYGVNEGRIAIAINDLFIGIIMQAACMPAGRRELITYGLISSNSVCHLVA